MWTRASRACTTSTATWEKRLLSSMKAGTGLTGCTTSCIRMNFCASCRFLSVRFTYRPWSTVPHCRGREAVSRPGHLCTHGCSSQPGWRATGNLNTCWCQCAPFSSPPTALILGVSPSLDLSSSYLGSLLNSHPK